MVDSKEYKNRDSCVCVHLAQIRLEAVINQENAKYQEKYGNDHFNYRVSKFFKLTSLIK